MTLEEANALLDEAPVSDSPSRLNPGITQRQAVDIVRKGIVGPRAIKEDGHLIDLLEKRVYQVARNQRRPRY